MTAKYFTTINIKKSHKKAEYNDLLPTPEPGLRYSLLPKASYLDWVGDPKEPVHGLLHTAEIQQSLDQPPQPGSVSWKWYQSFQNHSSPSKCQSWLDEHPLPSPCHTHTHWAVPAGILHCLCLCLWSSEGTSCPLLLEGHQWVCCLCVFWTNKHVHQLLNKQHREWNRDHGKRSS